MDRDAEACLEPGVTCTEADVGGGEQVDPAAHTGGVHGADHRLGTGHEPSEQALQRCSSFHNYWQGGQLAGVRNISNKSRSDLDQTVELQIM